MRITGLEPARLLTIEPKSIASANSAISAFVRALEPKSSVIHVSLNQKRIKIESVEAKIVGIYDNFIRVTSIVNGYEESFSISYIDLYTGDIAIRELQI